VGSGAFPQAASACNEPATEYPESYEHSLEAGDNQLRSDPQRSGTAATRITAAEQALRGSSNAADRTAAITANDFERAVTIPAVVTTASPAILSPATLAAQRLIAQIHHLADQYWEEPDHEALNVVLAFIASYFLHERNPLWLHIVGESSSGKTELGMAPVALDYAEFHHLDDLTANTLLSGLTKGKDSGKRNSFLHRVGIFGLVYQEDFIYIFLHYFLPVLYIS
jgi:hypothetical protein